MICVRKYSFRAALNKLFNGETSELKPKYRKALIDLNKGMRIGLTVERKVVSYMRLVDGVYVEELKEKETT